MRLRETSYHYPAILSIAGSDSGGGAGIQADLKTFSALGCYGTTAITAVTVQNTLGVSAIHPVPPPVVEGQIRAVMDDIRPAAIKTGMLYNNDLVLTVARVLKDYPDVPVIADPVMTASSGDTLSGNQIIHTFKQELFPIITLLTPNLDEAAALTGIVIQDVFDMQEAARILIALGCTAVLVKGGHLPGPKLSNVYLHRDGTNHIFHSAVINSVNTHGTGCSLSAAIAALLVSGLSMIEAVEQASAYVHQAILKGRDVKTGKGKGPINHFFAPQILQKK